MVKVRRQPITMTRALIVAIWLLSAISSSSSSSTSAYYNNYSPYHCNRADCCWALKVSHWNIHNICSGCEGQEVCNNNSPRTPRPTEKPTKKPTVTNSGYGGDSGGGVPQNFCCQTTGNCPIDTPVKTHRQWLDRANRIKLTYCCEYSVSSWKGDSWEKGSNNGRSLQALLPLCINTAEPTSSPTSIPSLQPSSTPTATPSATPSTEPSASPSEAPSTAPSSDPSSVPSSIPSSAPSDTPSQSPSSDPSFMPSSNPSESPSSAPSDTPSFSSQPSELPSNIPSTSSQPSSNPSESPSSKPSESPSSIPSSSPSNTPSLSSQPSKIPSDQPSSSSQPSINPSETPSSIPSSSPSITPSLSSQPSKIPSDQPSTSSQPSSNPSETTVSIPSSSPSNFPSLSLSPSYTPSSSSVPSLSAQPSTPIRVGVYSQFFRDCDSLICNSVECIFETDNIVSIVRHFIVTDTKFANFESDTSIQSYADPDLETKLDNMAMFIMPNIEGILSGWDTGSQTILENYVADGGVLLVTGDYSGVPFLNEIFGWGLAYIPCSISSTSKNVTNTADTVFSDSPATLDCSINTSSISFCNNVDCIFMYGDESGGSVVVIEHGDGRVIFLGFDFNDTGYEVNGFHKNCPGNENDWVVSILRSSLLLAAGGAV